MTPQGAEEIARPVRAKFPWDEALRFGLGVLRLSPRAFWATTPRELHAAAEGIFGRTAGALTRNHLGELMRRFPDVRRT